MRLYHGGAKGLSEIVPSSMSGIIRKGEECRRGFRNVSFFTTDFSEALRYAGKSGCVYLVESKEATRYCDIVTDLDIKKQVGESIYISPTCEVVATWNLAPRKRGQKQKYDLRMSI